MKTNGPFDSERAYDGSSHYLAATNLMHVAFLAFGMALCVVSKAAAGELRIRPIDPKQAAAVSYERQVRPLLAVRCFLCHSEHDRQGDFEMTSIKKMSLRGKKAGAGIIPGKPDESSIVQFIRGVREPQMPWRMKPLSEDELHLIRMWIQAGARDDTRLVKRQPSRRKRL